MSATSKKQKPPVYIRLDHDLEQYLRERAAAGHRTLTSEIRMRLELTRTLEQQQKGQQQ